MTSLIGINLKLTCHRYEGNINPNIIYSNIYTIEQLKKADQIFQIANDCEDVQWIFEEVILAKSVGILENTGYLDVYFYMSVSGRKAKVILRLNVAQIQKMPPRPTMPINNINNNMNNNIDMNEYQKNQERLSKLQYDANQLIKEQRMQTNTIPSIEHKKIYKSYPKFETGSFLTKVEIFKDEYIYFSGII